MRCHRLIIGEEGFYAERAFTHLVAEGEADHARVAVLDAHEEFVEHIESGQARIRVLSLITIVVAFILLASYFDQVLTPFTTGTKVVTVNLLDPTLLALELILIAVTFAWLYVGVVNYLFASRLGRQIKEARAKEKEIEGRLGSGA
jgi:hypothetical protein